jgi:hypothetical protein
MCMASLRDNNHEHSNLMASIVSDRLFAMHFNVRVLATAMSTTGSLQTHRRALPRHASTHCLDSVGLAVQRETRGRLTQ